MKKFHFSCFGYEWQYDKNMQIQLYAHARIIDFM